jgi:Zn-dependent protease/predicted transcriptional regulator
MQLARILGIRIGVNASWFLVLFLFVFLLTDQFAASLGGSRTAAYLAAVAASLLFFGSIVLHELGHALAARRDGIDVDGIDLFFFGGLMRMSRDTDSPGAEFRVAAAGPLVTVAIVVLGTLVGVALTGSTEAFVRTATLAGATNASVVELLISFLVSMNVLLLVLNLVPAFPLDGGRIARAIAWKLTGDRIKATRISAVLGQGFAMVLIAYGVLLAVQGAIVNGLWLVVLGWLLGQAARSAVAQTAFSERLRGVSVADIMDSEPVAIPSDTPAMRAWEDFFLRYQGWKWFPVVDADQRPVGIAHRAAVEHAAHEEDGITPVREVAVPADQAALVDASEPVEVLVGAPELRARGGLLAVDGAGRLRGVVTIRRVAQALSAKLPPA